MNTLFSLLGLQSWKPVLTGLVLPPLPLLLLALAAVRLVMWRRGVGWTVALLATAGLWLGSTVGAAEALQRLLLSPPAALTPANIEALRREAAKVPTAIVVLGGGREELAPEYGRASLTPFSLERLRYGLWLSRQTGAPVGFSGGVGWADAGAVAEADVAAAIAAQEFGRPLRWTESDSHDTRENAAGMGRLLRRDGIQRVLLVSHVWHLPRAQRAFEEMGQVVEPKLQIVPAPVALAPRIVHPVLRWLPSGEGLLLMRQVLREALGRLVGA